MRNNDVLKSVLDEGGFDVAGYLDYETVDEDEVTLEETSTSTFQPSSSSTISSDKYYIHITNTKFFFSVR